MASIQHEVTIGDCTLIHGDAWDALPTLETESVSSVVTDPPYGYGFMGKDWDKVDTPFRADFWCEVLRILKPGGHALVFGGDRTFHRTAVALEDAGFELRHTILWLYGSGFPKSLDVGAAVDKEDANEKRMQRRLAFTEWMRGTGLTLQQATETLRNAGLISENGTMAGHFFAVSERGQPAISTRAQFEALRPHINADVPDWIEQLVDERTVESENYKRRDVIGQSSNGIAGGSGEFTQGNENTAGFKGEFSITTAHTDAARQWEGWKTALKPAAEYIALVRKPLSERNVAANVLRWGTGAINVDECRVATKDSLGGGMVSKGRPKVSEGWDRPWMHDPEVTERKKQESADKVKAAEELGRYPANVIHDGSDEVLEAFAVYGESKDGVAGKRNDGGGMWQTPGHSEWGGYGGRGTAARFFYSAKASKRDRDCGGTKTTHPTVKPLSLMAYLCRLITPPGGTVLDPFAGSGTTLQAAVEEGFKPIGIEREDEYAADIERRLSVKRQGKLGY